MQHKSKKTFSELSTFFKNNDNSDAIFSVNGLATLREVESSNSYQVL